MKIAVITSIVFFNIILISGCDQSEKDSKLINVYGTTIKDRIQTPEGYQRGEAHNSDWAGFLENCLLSPHEFPILDFNGNPISNQGNHVAIINYDIGSRDLQQCADAVIRMRAEYLYHTSQLDKIAFNFTSGDLYGYAEYLEGKRPVVSGNNVTWATVSPLNDSYINFRNYLNIVFAYAGTISLSRYLSPIPAGEEFEAGDVIVNPGSPGHAVIIVDKATSPGKEPVYLIAEGYTPAQSIHILDSREKDIAPWFRLGNSGAISTPRYFFESPMRRRF